MIVLELQFFCLVVAGNIFYFMIYKFKLPFFEKYKALEDPWPWESDPEEWNKLFWRSIKFTLFNCFITPKFINAPFVLLNLPLDNPYDYNFPLRFELFTQVLFCLLIEDITFYLSHSLLHTPYLYKKIHKYHHEHKISTSLAMIHAHPLEYALGNVMPSTFGVLMLGKRMHFSSYMAWSVVRTINSLDGHCGYDFTWVPFRLLPFKLDG